MKMLPEKEEFLQNTIRDCMAVNPFVSIRKMQELVKENTGHSISDKYTVKLMRKIRRRAVIQSDRKKMNERLAEVREKFRILTDDLFRIVYWRADFIKKYGLAKPRFHERISAMRLLGQMELMLFRAELDAGTFENRQVAIGEMLERGILPTELREQVIGVFRTWKMRPIHSQDEVTSNE